MLEKISFLLKKSSNILTYWKKILRNKKFKANKKTKNMKNIARVGIGVGIVLIIAIIGYQVNETGLFVTQFPDEYQTLGPLTIDKKKYVLGENVFSWMSLHPLESGTVSFYTPTGKNYYEKTFNGSKKPDPQFYFRPTLDFKNDMCVKEDIIGTWTAQITGKTLTADQKNLTNVPKELQFEFVDKTLPGYEAQWQLNYCDDDIDT